jgi:hypothetical protein
MSLKELQVAELCEDGRRCWKRSCYSESLGCPGPPVDLLTFFIAGQLISNDAVLLRERSLTTPSYCLAALARGEPDTLTLRLVDCFHEVSTVDP